MRAVTLNSEEELDDALRQLCGLMSSRSPDDLRQLETLAEAVEAYERVHHPVAEPSHAGLLQHLLNAKGVSAQTAARATRVSLKSLRSILSGQREVLPAEARVLAKYFAVDPLVFRSNAEVSPTPSDAAGLGESV